jgi:putative membrane protein
LAERCVLLNILNRAAVSIIVSEHIAGNAKGASKGSGGWRCRWVAEDSTRTCKEKQQMIKLLIHWVLSAITLMVISHYLSGFHVVGLEPALIAALVIGLLNATLGLVLKIITFPITIITLGLFLLVINAAMILLASHIVHGFRVTGWIPALWGAVALALVGIAVHAGSKRV